MLESFFEYLGMFYVLPSATKAYVYYTIVFGFAS